MRTGVPVAARARSPRVQLSRPLVGLALALWLAGCTAPPAAPASGAPPVPQATTAPEPAPIRMGILGVLADLPIYLAEARGYLREQGLTVQLEQFRSGAEMFPALATNQLQAGWTAPTAALFNAYATDVDVRIVASYGRADRDRNNIIFIVSSQSNIREPRDLQGKTIAINSKGTISYFYADRVLRRRGEFA